MMTPATASPPIRALLVGTDPHRAAAVFELVRRINFPIEMKALQQVAALSRELDPAAFDIILVGCSQSDNPGLTTLRRVITAAPTQPVIALAYPGMDDLSSEALQLGAQDWLDWNQLNPERLGQAVRNAVERIQAQAGLLAREKRNRALLEALPDLILRLRRDGTYLDYQVSPDFPTLVPAEQIIGSNLFDLYPAEVAEEARAYIERALSSGEKQVFEYQLSIQGKVRYFEARMITIGEDEVLCIVRDITDRQKAEETLRRYAERLRILRNIDQAILAAQSPEAIAKATLRHIQSLVPCQRGSIAVFDLESQSITVFATYAPQKLPRGTGTLLSFEAFAGLEILQRGQVDAVGDILAIPEPSPGVLSLRAEGVRAYLRAPLISKDELIGALSLEAYEPQVFNPEQIDIAREVADSLAIAIRQARLFSQVQRLAITDELTGISNRRHFFDLARREFERVRRYGGELSAIMLDVDDFKAVNDRYGHAIGDRVLRRVAERIDQSIRETDILGRYGGDEFVILLPETSFVSAHRLAERLRHWMALNPVDTDRGSLTVTISLGVASWTDQVASINALIDLADADMYATKQAR